MAIRYLIEKIGNEASYLTDTPGGRAFMWFDARGYRVLTEDGWQKTSHKNFLYAEVDEDNKNVHLFYQGQAKSTVVPIPEPVDASIFKLTPTHIEQVINQMKEEGRIYDDFDQEYYEGTNTTYRFEKEKQVFTVTRMDIVAGSFYQVDEISESTLREFLLENCSFHELREQGFRLKANSA